MNKIINEFLEMKEVDKSCLFRLIDKIELNTITENIDEFIEIEEILDVKKLISN